jgi:hypothetical protein
MPQRDLRVSIVDSRRLFEAFNPLQRKFVRIPTFCVKFFVPFRNKMTLKRQHFARDQSAQILLDYSLPKFLFES